MTSTSEGLKTINDWADFWRSDIGVNVIPANTKKKETYVSWKEWQDNPVPEDQHKEWKTSGMFDNGIAIILGKVHHKRQKEGLYLIGIDCDNEKAIEEICSRNDRKFTLSQLAQWTLVEQHEDDPTKAHVLLYSHKPFPKKSSDSNGHLNSKLSANEVPAIEVKGLGSHGILFVTPSIHKNGQPYQIIGVNDPVIEDDFVTHIDNICKKYSIPYLDGNGNGNAQVLIQDLFKSGLTIVEGHNRHEALMRIMESLLARNSSILSYDQIKSLAREWISRHCSLPLDDQDFEKQWKCATDFISKNGNDPKQGREDDNDDNKNLRLPVAEKLVELVTQNSNSFFKDQYGAPYANIKTTDHNEIVGVESSKFKRHLIRLYFESEKRVANAEAVNNAVQVLYAKAEYEGKTIPLSLRVASYNGDFYYDLTNDKWQCVKITKDSPWSVVDKTPIPLFDRYNHHIGQAYPSHDYEPDEFDRFIDLAGIKKKEDRILIKVYIVSLFIPGIQHVILQVCGEQGGAKSMLETLIKELVDPAKPRLLSVHKDRMEFIQQLAQNHLVFYDNLKYTPSWLSDEVCRAVTGTGSSKRKLYTDSDAIVYEYQRCPGFNGINLVLTEPDALDRSIIIERERIKEENMIEETKVLKAFYELRPRLLGCIFDILSKTLQIKPTVELKRFSRMGDFTIWSEAIARAMGYKDFEFIEAYSDNRGKQSIEAIENNSVGQAVSRFLNTWYYQKEQHDDENEERPKCWFGTTSDFLEVLKNAAIEHNINTVSKTWPKAVNSLTKRLKIFQSNIREGLGFDISITRITTGKRKGLSSIKIWKIPSPSSPSSPDQNQAQNQGQNGEDTEGSEDTNPHQVDEPSPENHENRAQNEAGEGSEGSEDTFRTLTGASTSYSEHEEIMETKISERESTPDKVGYTEISQLQAHHSIPKTEDKVERAITGGKIKPKFMQEAFASMGWYDYDVEAKTSVASPYQHLLQVEYLPNIGQYFSCKEHPDVWNKDLNGLEISHFQPFHTDKDQRTEVNNKGNN